MITELIIRKLQIIELLIRKLLTGKLVELPQHKLNAYSTGLAQACKMFIKLTPVGNFIRLLLT
jgi:hypothetical protein